MTLPDRDNGKPVTERELMDGYNVPRDYCSNDVETAALLAYEEGRAWDEQERPVSRAHEQWLAGLGRWPKEQER